MHLKAWIRRPTCPPAVRECAALFNKFIVSMNDGRLDPTDEEVSESSFTASFRIPGDSAAYFGNDGHIQACLRFDGVHYARSTAHLGNSLIYFYPDGNRAASPAPGQIEYIWTRAGKPYFAIRRHLPAPHGTVDPFRFYEHLPIKLYSSELTAELTMIKAEWVAEQFARWRMKPHLVALVSLSRVSAHILLIRLPNHNALELGPLRPQDQSHSAHIYNSVNAVDPCHRVSIVCFTRLSVQQTRACSHFRERSNNNGPLLFHRKVLVVGFSLFCASILVRCTAP